MSTISVAKADYDSKLAGYGASPPTATLAELVTALSALVGAIENTNPPPTSPPDQTTYDGLESYRATLATLKTSAQQALAIEGISVADSYEGASGVKDGQSVSDKYYQIGVPNFTLKPSAPAGGNSFVRMGTFPSLTDAAAGPPGFPKSLELAKLVADDSITANTPRSGDDNPDTVPFTANAGHGLDSYHAGGDSNYLLGFADDTRHHAMDVGSSEALSNLKTLTNGSAVDNTRANRQTETSALLTKGGWWDHSDGNRISTTVGDKVEVIQGNYKLVVLGRQPLLTSTSTTDDATRFHNNAFITDVSGGHFQEQYPSPTPCIKTVEYSQNDQGEWTLYQDNGKGNLITKLKGRTVDMFEGWKRETYVGTSSGDGSLNPEIISKTWAQRSESWTGSDDKPVAKDVTSYTFAQRVYSQVGSEKTPIGTSTEAADGNLSAGVGDGDKPGDITSKTWAQRIRSYTGSVTTPVVHMFSLTYALEIENYTFAASTMSFNGAASNLDVTLGLKTSINAALLIDVWTAGKLTVALDPWMEVTLDKTGFHATKNELNAFKTGISGKVNTLQGALTGISAEQLNVTALKTQLSELYTALAAVTAIGA